VIYLLTYLLICFILYLISRISLYISYEQFTYQDEVLNIMFSLIPITNIILLLMALEGLWNSDLLKKQSFNRKRKTEQNDL
jgi:tellurite resistance protein TehA-like permease